MNEEKYEMVYPKDSEHSSASSIVPRRHRRLAVLLVLLFMSMTVAGVLFYFQLTGKSVEVEEDAIGNTTAVSQPPKPLTEAEKLEILDSLKSGAVEVSEEKRRETLNSLSTQNSKESQMTKEEKLKILESL